MCLFIELFQTLCYYIVFIVICEKLGRVILILFWQLLMDILAATLVCIASLIQEEFMFTSIVFTGIVFTALKML